jgi:hypothetical protein
MTPKRITAKFFVTPDPAAGVDLDPFIGIFHRFIQEKSLEGLLIDVADYIHVPEGPGVILIGHDVDYGIDLVGGEAGLLTTRKRIEEGTLAEALIETLRKALGAIKAIEADSSSGLRFATDRVRLQIFDRLAAPNAAEAYDAAKAEFEALATRLFAGSVEAVRRTDATDARNALAVELVASDISDVDTLLGRLAR